MLFVKSLIQQLWMMGRGWDEPAPPDIQKHFDVRRNELPCQERPVPRRLIQHESPVLFQQLHGFSDASQAGYGAVIYVKTLHSNASISMEIVVAKAKVTLKKMVADSRSRLELTIPRLELLAGHLLSQLMSTTAASLKIPEEGIYCWTDSQIVLAWLKKPPEKVDIFVKNRTCKILQSVPEGRWNYVRTKDNPADVASRGLSPSQLVKKEQWWKGPPWLQQHPKDWPTEQLPSSPRLPGIIMAVLPAAGTDLQFLEKFSSFEKAVRVLAYCLRRKSKRQPRLADSSRQAHPPSLSFRELCRARLAILHHLQHLAWPSEFRLLNLKKPIPTSSALGRLNPFIDKDGLLRVGGRLERSDLPFSSKHPILLPKRSSTVRLLIEHLHRMHGHPGSGTLTSIILRDYHPMGATQLFKRVCRECVVCKKALARTKHQLMLQLPPVRTQPLRPFQCIEVDFASPFTTKRGYTRKPMFEKSYMALFICLATKAIHFEVTEDLSTGSFLLCFERFISRRGCPSHVLSDNGSNFVGAARILGQPTSLPYNLAEFSDKISNFSPRNVQWHFIPARSPHFGGIWEAGVRNMKIQLRKLMDPFVPTLMELNHLAVFAEGVLNSYPLVPVYLDDGEKFQCLIPGHFLLGRPIRAHAEDLPNDPRLHSVRWSTLHKECQQLWKRWHSSYLQSLQSKSKWTKPQENVRPGNIVLLKDETLAKGRWPLGRVVKMQPGPDGLVRVATLLINGKEYTRAIHRLVPLTTTEEARLPLEISTFLQQTDSSSRPRSMSNVPEALITP